MRAVLGNIDPKSWRGLYKYDQGPIFPSMTPALRQTCLFWRQKTEICVFCLSLVNDRHRHIVWSACMCYDLLLLFLQGEVMEEHEDVRRNIAEKVS